MLARYVQCPGVCPTVCPVVRDLQGHSSVSSYFKCDFSYSYEAFDEILTDKARRAIPLR